MFIICRGGWNKRWQCLQWAQRCGEEGENFSEGEIGRLTVMSRNGESI